MQRSTSPLIETGTPLVSIVLCVLRSQDSSPIAKQSLVMTLTRAKPMQICVRTSFVTVTWLRGLQSCAYTRSVGQPEKISMVSRAVRGEGRQIALSILVSTHKLPYLTQFSYSAAANLHCFSHGLKPQLRVLIPVLQVHGQSEPKPLTTTVHRRQDLSLPRHVQHGVAQPRRVRSAVDLSLLSKAMIVRLSFLRDHPRVQACSLFKFRGLHNRRLTILFRDHVRELRVNVVEEITVATPA